jgi:hypothetical protein
MPESLLSSVFLEVSKETLEAETAVCFVIDEQLRLIYCNPAWDRFAMQNDAPHVRGEHLLGAPVLDSTSGDLLDHYRALYNEVLADGNPRGHDFFCSSPDVERLMRMQIYRLRNVAALLVTCSIRREQPHGFPSAEPIQARYRNRHGLIVMCSGCRRVRRVAEGPDTWDWVTDFVRHLPARVSHGLCNLCFEYYYAAEK